MADLLDVTSGWGADEPPTFISASEDRLLSLVLARLPVHLRRALRDFRGTTRQRAVFSLAKTAAGLNNPASLPPPIHPLCRARLRKAIGPPCARNWREHVRRSTTDRAIQTHVCTLGLHCTHVPIYVGSILVGAVRLVERPETMGIRSTRVAATLVLTVTQACERGYLSVLQGQMAAMQQRIDGLVQLGIGTVRRSTAGHGNGRGRPDLYVRGALRFLSSHYQDPGLGLSRAAAAVGCNPKYLARLFTGIVGVRMRTYLIELRLNHACRQLVSTDRLVKEIAFNCGFRDGGGFARAFRRHFGASPARYRSLFDGRHA